MNPNTGHLMTAAMAAEFFRTQQIGAEEFAAKFPPGYEQLPPELQPEARRMLRRGKQYVNLRSQSPLAAWAKAARKKKARAKMAKASKRRNRR